ncbi:VOC family protein [Bacillus sp. Bos-x628]|uniref:VOC family protein n=1 Tax=Bacillus maqinnsis TaxID=3229854 RepID=UPI0033905480
MGRQAKNVYINLPVKHVNTSRAFFEQLGFDFHQRFSNDQVACVIINERMIVMLISHKHFQFISEKQLVDARNASEIIMSLQVDTREEVNELMKKAIAAGGSPFKEKQDHDFMYGWGFQDLDGHLWEVFYMDEEKGSSLS